MRTRIQSLKHILANLDEDKLGAMSPFGGCVYVSDDGQKFCGVGCLFSSKQLTDIRNRKLLGVDISTLAYYIGNNNIETVTGMTLEELTKIQTKHDMAVSNNGKFFEPHALMKHLIMEIANAES